MEKSEQNAIIDDIALLAFIVIAGWFLMFVSGLF